LPLKVTSTEFASPSRTNGCAPEQPDKAIPAALAAIAKASKAIDLVIGPVNSCWPALCRFSRRLSIAGRRRRFAFRCCG